MSDAPLDATRPVRWGILATGTIAHAFARDLALIPDAEVAAVGARRLESAQAFTAEFGGRAHPSYEALVADPDVDVVYVASPHALHHEHVRLCLEAGKPVLCEKAFTMNAAQAGELLDLAESTDLFLMEAMWMACHPLIRTARDRLTAGDFGEPRQLYAELGFVVDAPPEDRLLAPELGGGALLDMGIYPLTLAQLLLGPPEHVSATGVLSESGIDLDTVVTTRHGDAVAVSSCSMSSASGRRASLATTEGRLDWPSGFHHPSYLTWTPYDGRRPREPVRLDPPAAVIGTGLGNEAVEVMRCLRAGERQSDLVPHAHTLSMMRLLDEVRAQIGLRYPGER